jgi:hypothetical protein
MGRRPKYYVDGLLGVRFHSVVITELYEEARCAIYICDCGRTGLARANDLLKPRSTFRDCGCGIHKERLAGIKMIGMLIFLQIYPVTNV